MKTILLILACLNATAALAQSSVSETVVRSCVRDGTNYMVHFVFDPNGLGWVPATNTPGHMHYPCTVTVFGNGLQVGTNFTGEVTRKGCFEDRPEDAVAKALSQNIKPK